MTQIPIFVLVLCHLSQTAPPVESSTGAAAPALQPAEAAPINGTVAAATLPVTPVESEADKAVRAAADKIDGIEYLSAKIRQSIRAAGKSITSNGTFKRGPEHRSRLELIVDIGGGSARRVNASDGTTCAIYEKILDHEDYQTFDVKQVMPLLDTREVTPEIRQNLFLLPLPFVAPGDMLRGYLKSMRFDAMRDGTLGDPPRPVTIVDGQWRDELIALVAQDPNAKKIEDLPEGTPQYIRIHLDKATGFPLRVELYRKDKRAEYKPVFELDFVDVTTEKLADTDFAFEAPLTAKPVDVTSDFVRVLSQLPEKIKTPAAAAESVAEPLQPSPMP